VTDEYIEDCLIHLEDMGFKIESFDNVTSSKYRTPIFTDGEISNTDSSGRMWGYQPTEGRLYRCHHLILSKKIKRFSDSEVWTNVLSELKSFKRKMTRCDVYYSFSIGEGNVLMNDEVDMRIRIFVVDKSEKIDQSSVDRRQQMVTDLWNFLEEESVSGFSEKTMVSWTDKSLIIDVVLGKKEEGSKNKSRMDKKIDYLINFIDGESDKKNFEFKTDIVDSKVVRNVDILKITLDF
jgi:hypothetical protein